MRHRCRPSLAGIRRFLPGLVVGVLAVLVLLPAVRADAVTRRGGGRIQGHVVRVDEQEVVVRTSAGEVRLPRKEVASIRFELGPAAPPPMKIEIRNVASDDSVDVLLDGEVVIADASSGGSWIDLTPRLNDGNHALRLRIRNARGTWAYQLSLRINGRTTPIRCGVPHRPNRPCRCCGKTGHELGVIDDLPPLWLHVDRALGRAEILSP